MLLEPFRDRRYRPYLVFRPLWEISLTLLGPFPTIYLLGVLEDVSIQVALGSFSIYLGQFSIIALFTALQILIGVFTYPVWGVLLERYGSKPVLQLSTLFITLTPLLWLFVTREHLIAPTLILFIVVGATFSGLNVSIVSLLIGIAPKRNRSMYVAVDLTVTSLVGALGPILAGFFIDFIGDSSWQVLGLSVGGFQLLCLGTFAVRMYTRTFLFRIQEGAKITTAGVVRRLAEANPLRVFTNIYALAAPSSEARRINVVSRLGDTRSKLATQDLIQLLDDPSSRVREEALNALAKSKDPEAVDAIVRILGHPDYGLEQQAAKALGQIGDSRAVDPLINALDHPEARIRAGAALALAEIGDPRGSREILARLQNEKAAVAFHAYATALSQLGEIVAIWQILPAMRELQSPVRQRELAIALGNLLGKPGVFYHHLDEEFKVFGQRAEKLVRYCRRQAGKEPIRKAGSLRRSLLEMMEEVENSYLDKSWHQLAEVMARISGLLTDFFLSAILHEDPDQERSSEVLTNPFAKISLIVSHDDKLGMQLWYMEELGRRADTKGGRLGLEDCLLDLYILGLVMSRVGEV